MINITDKKACCGCWACANICPQGCISMMEDSEGFRYPHVRVEGCIDCGLCEKVCPELKPEVEGDVPKSFVVQNCDTHVRRHSTSGGFYAAISDYVIRKGGVVFGAAFESDHVVRHSYAETKEDCVKFQVSKYVQSLIGETYKQAKNFLDAGRLVVFSGTPCQIAGLYGYLRGRKYENLVSVDLVCHGTPSPRLLSQYLCYQESVYGSKVLTWKSRDKYYGYDYITTNIEFADKSIHYHKGSESDLLFRLYFKNICSRPSCYQCHFRTLSRMSDFTIFDCWDAPSVSREFDAKGATNVFVHSAKGLEIFEALKPYFKWSESDIERVVERDGIMISHNVPEHPQRAEFFEDLGKLPLDEIERKYLNSSWLKRLIATLKPVLYKLGVFGYYLWVKRRLQDWHILGRM